MVIPNSHIKEGLAISINLFWLHIIFLLKLYICFLNLTYEILFKFCICFFCYFF
jgi:hypothetical protein